jgi:hypothetical protein
MRQAWQINKTIEIVHCIKEERLPVVPGIIKLYDAAMPLGKVSIEPFRTLSGLFSETLDILSEKNLNPNHLGEADYDGLSEFSDANRVLLNSVCDELLELLDGQAKI